MSRAIAARAAARAAGASASRAGDPIHVLQLIETGGPGGAERILVNLAAALDRDAAFESSVGLLKDGWVAAELRGRAIEPHLFPLRRALDPALAVALARHIRRTGVDLVHTHEFTMNVYGVAAAALAGRPAVATVHGRGYYAGAARRRLALRGAAALGAAMVAVSADIRDFLRDEVGIGKVLVIPNGIDVDRVAAGDRARGRAALDLPAGTPIIGTVGNLYPVKGHRVLLMAAARLETPVHIVIAGRGAEEIRLLQQAAELGLGDRLHLLGYREDIPDLLAAFDIYALPSFSEGQSLALIEAMAAGLPVVATAVGGNPEVLGVTADGEEEDGAAGVVVPAGDPAVMARALGRLLADPAAARRYGAAARARARAELSLEAMLGRYRALYAERLAVARGRRAAAARVLDRLRGKWL